jgi:transposase-like protein
MARKATFDPSTKAAAVYLLRRGMATYQEVATLAGVSRQIVRHWAQEFPTAREEYLAKVWERARRRTGQD